MTEGIGMFKAYDIRARFGDLPAKAMDTLADAVVRYFLLEVTGWPLISLKADITVPVPASTAARNAGR